MAHGKTLQMRRIKRPAPIFVHEHPGPVKMPAGIYLKPGEMKPYFTSKRAHLPTARERNEALGVTGQGTLAALGVRPPARRPAGSARRRAKAVARASYAVELDLRQAFRQDRIPRHAIAVNICGCGRTSWLMEGASEDEWARFREDDVMHECDLAQEVSA